MPDWTSYPDLDLAELGAIPDSAEVALLRSGGQTYNITWGALLGLIDARADARIAASGGEDGGGFKTGIELSDALDAYLGSATWRTDQTPAAGSITNAMLAGSIDLAKIVAPAEGTVLGRLSGGALAGLTPAEVRTLLNVADGAQVNPDGDTMATAIIGLSGAARATFMLGLLSGKVVAGQQIMVNDAGTDVEGVDLVALAVASGATVITGTDAEAMVTADSIAEANTAASASSASGAITLAFASTLRRTTTLTENITDVTVTGLTDFYPAFWEITGHASNPYTVAFDSGVWIGSAYHASLTVAANSKVVVMLRKDGADTIVSVGSTATEIA